VFLGFPLHAAGKPSSERAGHLMEVGVPMLFVQGTRDSLADYALTASLVKTLGRRATLLTVAGGDHSFHVPVRSGRTDDQARAQFLDGVARWIGDVVPRD
jgi:predicted alpha/beta-hydrolase family hydrolase